MQTAYLPFPSSQSCPGPASDWWPREKSTHASRVPVSKCPQFQSAQRAGSLGLVQRPLDDRTLPGAKMLYSWELCPAFQPEDPLLQPLHRQILAKGQTKESENFVQIQQGGAEAQGRTGLPQSQLPRPAMNWGCHPRLSAVWLFLTLL